MSEPSPSPLTSADMRHSAYAAPTGSLERRELLEAEQLRENERLASLGDAAAMVVELERKLKVVEGERRKAVIKANSAAAKLEELHQTLSIVLGKDTQPMRLVECAMALSQWKFDLTKLAGHIERAESLDDLTTLKRIVINMGIRQPAGFTAQAALIGLPTRKSA